MCACVCVWFKRCVSVSREEGESRSARSKDAVRGRVSVIRTKEEKINLSTNRQRRGMVSSALGGSAAPSWDALSSAASSAVLCAPLWVALRGLCSVRSLCCGCAVWFADQLLSVGEEWWAWLCTGHARGGTPRTAEDGGHMGHRRSAAISATATQRRQGTVVRSTSGEHAGAWGEDGDDHPTYESSVLTAEQRDRPTTIVTTRANERHLTIMYNK